MTGKADFTEEEWKVVLEGPPSAGMIVLTAQRGGTIRESVALAQTFRGRGRIGFEPDKSIPTPQAPIAINNALAGFQLRLQSPTRRLAVDQSGPR